MSDTPDRDAMLELVAAYALGVLPRSEHALVTAYLLADPQARAEFEALRPVADLVGLAAEEPVDSGRTARMKQRVLAAARTPAVVSASGTARRTSGERSSWFVGAGLAAAAAVVFAFVSTIQNFSLRSDLANANSRAASLQAQIAQNERVRMRDREMVADLIATDAQRFPVPQGEVIKRGTHVYLTLHSLPPLPRGPAKWYCSHPPAPASTNLKTTSSVAGYSSNSLPSVGAGR